MRGHLLLLCPMGLAVVAMLQWQLVARAERGRASELPVEAARLPPASTEETAGGPARTYTNTLHVEDLVADGATIWAATRGGVEEYDRRTLVRRRVYTTADGLDRNVVHQLELVEGRLVARTARQRCLLDGSRFVCTPATPLPKARPAIAPGFSAPGDGVAAGPARVNVRLAIADGELIGTAGLGLWIKSSDGAERRLSPAHQICSNHLVALTEFRGRLWLGSFDEGLCSFDGESFATPTTPFRRIHALLVTPRGLHVATSDGLYRTADGVSFELVDVPGVAQGPVNGLAYDGRSLWATTPGALLQIKVGRGGHTRSFWRPAGSRALQAVSVAAPVGEQDELWLASEDRGAIHFSAGHFEAFDRAAGLPSSWALDVAATADGGAYVATLRHGLVRVDPSGQSRSIEGLPDRWLLHASLDERDGAIWVGTQGGAARVDARGDVRILQGLPEPSVHALLRVGERLWVATEGGLLSAPWRR